MNPVTLYAQMAADARMGEILTPNGTAPSFAAVFPAHYEAAAFIRRAGGTNPVRVYSLIDERHAWRWTMPDGIVATLPDESDTVEFTRPEGGDR